MQRFHDVAWEERLPLVKTLKDPRLQKLGLQLIHVERPGLLSAPECSDHDVALARRMTGHKIEVPWLTLPKAIAELDALAATLGPSHAAFIEEHRAHLTDQMKRARQVLGI
jgi:hypothetical protein